MPHAGAAALFHILYTSVLISPNGEVAAKYRKLHTFDVVLPNGQEEKESHRVKPGSEMVCVRTELGCLGLSVCYDLRFPEMYRWLCLQGAQVLFVPAEFNIYTGKDHWEPLLQARLALCAATRTVLKNVLSLMKITAPESM